MSRSGPTPSVRSSGTKGTCARRIASPTASTGPSPRRPQEHQGRGGHGSEGARDLVGREGGQVTAVEQDDARTQTGSDLHHSVDAGHPRRHQPRATEGGPQAADEAVAVGDHQHPDRTQARLEAAGRDGGRRVAAPARLRVRVHGLGCAGAQAQHRLEHESDAFQGCLGAGTTEPRHEGGGQLRVHEGEQVLGRPGDVRSEVVEGLEEHDRHDIGRHDTLEALADELERHLTLVYSHRATTIPQARPPAQGSVVSDPGLLPPGPPRPDRPPGVAQSPDALHICGPNATAWWSRGRFDGDARPFFDARRAHATHARAGSRPLRRRLRRRHAAHREPVHPYHRDHGQ